MAKEPALLLTVFAGGLIAMQAPINSMLGRSVGTFASRLSYELAMGVGPYAGYGFLAFTSTRMFWYGASVISRGSTTLPAMAAAAQVTGLAR